MKKFFIALIGSTVVLIGIAMIVLPGPALIVIPAGLAILATEFLWARHALKKCKDLADHTRRKAREWWPYRRGSTSSESTEPPETKS
jgi:tellurite resistance protein TerC